MPTTRRYGGAKRTRAVELFQRRGAEQAARSALSPPVLHLIGMLMLVPVGVNLDLYDCTFLGPALPEPFVRLEMTSQLAKLGLLANSQDGDFQRHWTAMQRQLRSSGGPQSVCNRVVAPLAERLGFEAPTRHDDVATREGVEDGGWLMRAPCGARLRAWTFAVGHGSRCAPSHGARLSLQSDAQCAACAAGKRRTSGAADRWRGATPAVVRSRAAGQPCHNTARGQRRMANADPWRRIRIVWCWRLRRRRGSRRCPNVLDAARLSQTRVTKDLRLQARSAIEGFLQAVLDNPGNKREHECTGVRRHCGTRG